jgi:hypothetical protein
LIEALTTISFYLTSVLQSFHLFNPLLTWPEIQVELKTHDNEPRFLLEAIIRLTKNHSPHLDGDHERNDCAAQLKDV